MSKCTPSTMIIKKERLRKRKSRTVSYVKMGTKKKLVFMLSERKSYAGKKKHP
jgi:hypothetical protein